jgi:FMN reductase
MPPTIVGLGGSLRKGSTSRSALQRALAGAAGAGAETTLLDLRELELPMYDPDDDEPAEGAPTLIESCHAADGLLWSSPLYQGTISGAFKNALDWLHVLGRRDPPYLHDKVIGLISAAGGTQGLQAINTMEFSARALRGWAVPRASSKDSAARSCGSRSALPQTRRCIARPSAPRRPSECSPPLRLQVREVDAEAGGRRR